jgi:hypothetical protein
MGKSSEYFMIICEIKSQLESLTIEELQSLQPAYNEMTEQVINELIKEKLYYDK